MKEISVSALKVEQPIGAFYVAVFPSKTLVEITHVDIRTMVDEDLDRFMGIQRDYSRKRVDEIKRYVTTDDSTFPTSVVISVPESCAEWDEKKQLLTFREYIDEDNESLSVPMDSIAKIIDGQHRVRGLEDADDLGFQVLVSVFVGADEETEATIFATVNLAQTKVARSLVYDLYEFSKSRSPQKTCHDTAVLLNKDLNSPFHHRIKRLGSATEGRSELITQATFVNSLLPFVSLDPMKDRDLIRRNKPLAQPNSGDLIRMPFRHLFVAKDDSSIIKNVWIFFAAVRDRWPVAWATREAGTILPRTNGFRALMRYFHSIAPSLELENGKLLNKDQVLKKLRSIQLDEDDFTTENFKPGSSGSSKLYRCLVAGELIS